MKKIALLLVAGVAFAQAPAFQNVGNMSQLMVNLIYPASDAIFYVTRTPPKTDYDWEQLQNQALMLAESGNLLMMPGRTRQGDWDKMSKVMLDIGATAFKAAKAHDQAAIEALNDPLNDACIACHIAYRPNYRKYKQQNQNK